jgi:RNA polymerase sigma factor (sigma-70 family)
MASETIHTRECSDAELVEKSLAGNRGAFRQIVDRYKTLISSIAYSATGNVSRSEDLAQETFIAAWSQLGSLREPHKLSGWLRGIVRHRIHRDRRVSQREPVRDAESVDYAHELPAPGATPSELAIQRDEEAILWRSLERIPSLYREPLILFYREHRSVEQVAVALDLSEDAVKQRLSRGRRLLHEEVQAFVEDTLQRTAPSQAFSGAVVAMLPLAAGPAVGAAGFNFGAKGAAAAKAGFFASLLVPLAPFLGIAAGLAAHWLIIREATTERKVRSKRIAQAIVGWLVYLGLAVGGEAAVHAIGRYYAWNERLRFIAVTGFWWCFVAATIALQMVIVLRRQTVRAQPTHSVEHDVAFASNMRPATRALVVTGAHLALFSWLIALALRHHDVLGAAITTGTMERRLRPERCLYLDSGLSFSFGLKRPAHSCEPSRPAWRSQEC